MKIIKYYRKSNYGAELEYVHPESVQEGILLRHLTGKKTINAFVRESVTELTERQVTFLEVLAPFGNGQTEFQGGDK